MSNLRAFAAALREQLIREHAQAPGLFQEMARMESLLAETYRARVLYELLQNSDDAGSTTVTVDLTQPSRMTWGNDGRAFDEADIEALCRSASSTKTRGSEAIGYRGIGFKAVAALAASVRVTSNGVALTFDRELAAAALGNSTGTVPLLRVPASIDHAPAIPGAEFTLNLVQGHEDQLALDPIAMLFLRNVTDLTIRRPEGQQHLSCARSADRVALDINGRVAEFGRSASGETVALVPLNSQAESIVGRRGRLCCFLPLNDELALPVVGPATCSRTRRGPTPSRAMPAPRRSSRRSANSSHRSSQTPRTRHAIDCGRSSFPVKTCGRCSWRVIRTRQACSSPR